MEANISRNTILFGAVAVLAAVAIGSLALANLEARRKNAELVTQSGELKKQVAALTAAQQGMEKQLTDQKSELTRVTEAAEDLKRRNEAPHRPQLEIPDCVDSDGEYGRNAIYYRGSVRSGGGQSSDHCRLGQLVEFSCIENPPGSGILHAEGKLMDCPGGSRCVDGTCLR